MTLATPFRSPRLMAESVRGIMARDLGTYALRDYNRYDADASTITWLTPSTSWPAYRDTKFVFRQPFIPDAGTTEAGIHAEKGYGQSVRGSMPKSMIVDDAWHWRTFLKRFTDGDILDGMRETANEHNMPLLLRIDAYRSGSEYAVRDQVVYRLDPDAAALQVEFGPSTSCRILSEPDAKDADRIPPMLASLTAEPWVWVDVLVTALFTHAEMGAWDGERIWHDFLHPLALAVGLTRVQRK